MVKTKQVLAAIVLAVTIGLFCKLFNELFASSVKLHKKFTNGTFGVAATWSCIITDQDIADTLADISKYRQKNVDWDAQNNDKCDLTRSIRESMTALLDEHMENASTNANSTESDRYYDFIQQRSEQHRLLHTNLHDLLENKQVDTGNRRRLQKEISLIDSQVTKFDEEIKQEYLLENLEDIIACAYDIATGNHGGAVNKYAALKERRHRDQAIQFAYKREHLENILKFVEVLPKPLHKAGAYQKILYELQLNSDLASPLILNVNFFTERLLSLSRTFKNQPEELSETVKIIADINRKIREPIEALATRWGREIRESNKDEFQKQMNDYTETVTRHLRQISEQIYDHDEKSAITTLSTIASIRGAVIEKASVHIFLHESLTADQQHSLATKLRLAYSMKQLMDTDTYKSSKNSNFIRKYVAVWDEFPQTIQQIASGKEVCIRNQNHPNLHLDVETHKAGETGVVSTNDFVTKNAKWKFQSDTNAVSFQIVNVALQEFLSVATTEDASGRRNVISSSAGVLVPETVWEIKDANWTSNEFYIYNSNYGAYLNGKASEGERNGVFIIKDMGQNTVWIIDSC